MSENKKKIRVICKKEPDKYNYRYRLLKIYSAHYRRFGKLWCVHRTGREDFDLKFDFLVFNEHDFNEHFMIVEDHEK